MGCLVRAADRDTFVCGAAEEPAGVAKAKAVLTGLLIVSLLAPA